MSKRIQGWICTLLGPEITAMIAVGELRQAMSVIACRNSAFQALASNSNEDLSPRDNIPLPLPTTSPSSDILSSLQRWKVIQGFYINMRGVMLVTEDEWTYPFKRAMLFLIKRARYLG
jgi:hypothetical protein